jgi:hypothetical protein
MFLKRAWIPALAGLVLMVGCDSKPTDRIPTTAPAAVKEPQEILAHLKYLAVRKDFKDLAVIAPSDLSKLYSNAFWFHNHAGYMGISLTNEEIQALGVTELKALGYIAPGVSAKELQDAKEKVGAGTLAKLPPEMENLDLAKLDKLPSNTSKDKGAVKDYTAINGPMLSSVFNAGIYRLLKGVPTGMWNDISVMEVKQNLGDPKAKDVFLGYQGTSIMQLALVPKADGTYGVIYIYFKVHTKTLAKMFAEAQGHK